MYGKTIIKPIETDTTMKGSDDFEKYISLNPNYIDSALQINGRYYIKKVKPAMGRFNYVHCGGEILSVSRRVTDKVCPCCGDCVNCQDTDSILLNYDDVDKTADRFKKNIAKS